MQEKKKKRYKMSLKQEENAFGYLFTLPWIIGLLTLVIVPLGQSFFYALNDVRIKPEGIDYNYVGLDNFRDVFAKDLFFSQNLLNFSVSLVLQIPIIVIFALLIALLLNRNIKFKGVFRTIFFLPVIISSGAVMAKLQGQGATSIPNFDSNLIYEVLGSRVPTFLVEAIVELFASLILLLWRSGVQLLVFIAALQKIDPSLYEAAKIDGGSSWECFWKITIPTIRPVILLNAVYTIVNLANSSDNEIITLIYNNMFDARRGYGFASAMAWMYSFIILFILLLTYLLLRQRKERNQYAQMTRQQIEAEAYRLAYEKALQNDADYPDNEGGKSHG